MPRALDVVHTSSSAALFAIFLRCLLFTSHGPSWWCSRDKFRGTESGGATTTRPTGGKKNVNKQWRKWKNKLIWLIFFWKSFGIVSLKAMHFKNWCGMQQCSPHENTHTGRHMFEPKKATGDRRRWWISVSSWHDKQLPSSQMFKRVFTNLWFSIRYIPKSLPCLD